MKSGLLSILFFFVGACCLHAQAPMQKGDVVYIRITGIPEKENPYPGATFYIINNDGNVDLPALGTVNVAGLSTLQIHDAIQNRLVEEKAFPHPKVIVKSKPAGCIFVMGEVNRPRFLAFTKNLTLVKAITACGGFTDYAYKKGVCVTRDGAVTRYNFVQILKNPAQDPKLQPGDLIKVLQTEF